MKDCGVDLGPWEGAAEKQHPCNTLRSSRPLMDSHPVGGMGSVVLSLARGGVLFVNALKKKSCQWIRWLHKTRKSAHGRKKRV